MPYPYVITIVVIAILATAGIYMGVGDALREAFHRPSDDEPF